MSNITVVGSTSWGTTLALVFAKMNNVTLLVRTPQEAKILDNSRENRRFIPGVPFPASLKVTAATDKALDGADIVIIAVPSAYMKSNIQRIQDDIPKNALVISASKGIHWETGKRMTQIITSNTRINPNRVGALSGPNLAIEIAKGLPCSATVAMNDKDNAINAQSMLNSQSFRIYASNDVTGVELGGALKNIIAIGSGVIDGMGFGENTKAAFITRGLHEITRFAVIFGAIPQTLYGLSGMGDLIATCHSNLSRNRKFGLELAKGTDVTTSLKNVGQVVEGINTCKAVERISRKVGISMPITSVTYDFIEGKITIKEALKKLMSRELQQEALLL